jgi:penicillin-binding protein 1C
VSPRTAFWISDVLADAEAREFIFGRGGSLEFAFPVAVKTGTSQAYHDNWTIGFTRDVTVGVWVGNFDRSPLRNSSGVTGAAPIFHAVMLAASARFSRDIDHGDIVRRPQDVHPVEVCAVSGQAVSEWCPLKQREWLPQRILARPCDWHRRVGDTTELVLAPQYHAWADSEMNRHHGARALTVEQRLPTTTGLQIASPPDGATYLIDPTLRRDFQTLTLRVVSASDASIEWSVNGVTIAAAAAGEAVDWPLTPGRHRVVARTVDGKEAVASIDVR